MEFHRMKNMDHDQNINRVTNMEYHKMANIDLNIWNQSPSKPKTLIKQDDKNTDLVTR